MARKPKRTQADVIRDIDAGDDDGQSLAVTPHRAAKAGGRRKARTWLAWGVPVKHMTKLPPYTFYFDDLAVERARATGSTVIRVRITEITKTQPRAGRKERK